jgi:uncharacterized protein YkwD
MALDMSTSTVLSLRPTAPVIRGRVHAFPDLMKRPSLRPHCCLLFLVCALATTAAPADPVSAVQLLRTSGCGGTLPALPALRGNGKLDRAAALWAAGQSLVAAAADAGYSAQAATGLRLSGPDDSILSAMRRTQCHAIADRSLRDVGSYRRGTETWMVMASAEPGNLQSSSSAAALPSASAHVLQLVNEVRANGTRCGGKSFGPAPPLQRSGTLDSVASQHAVDMARHDYFEHVDLSGRSPADRVRASGYRGILVGENIAYGPASADEAVTGWLQSTGHCENIMDPRFVEMGLAVAPGHGAKRGMYWDQVLTEPAK